MMGLQEIIEANKDPEAFARRQTTDGHRDRDSTAKRKEKGK